MSSIYKLNPHGQTMFTSYLTLFYYTAPDRWQLPQLISELLQSNDRRHGQIFFLIKELIEINQIVKNTEKQKSEKNIKYS